MQDILLIIPSYNEEKNIETVVGELVEKFPQLDYLVVNDGSADRTGQICRERGYHMLDLPVNLGLAGCFQAGMKYAYRKGYRYAIQFDGDGQHRPEYIEGIRRKMDEGYDIVIGSRFVDRPKDWSARMLGSRLLSGAIRLTTGARVADPTSGMRMFNREMIREFALNLNYGPEPDTGGRGSGGDFGTAGRRELFKTPCGSTVYGADADFHSGDSEFPETVIRLRGVRRRVL